MNTEKKRNIQRGEAKRGEKDESRGKEEVKRKQGRIKRIGRPKEQK